MITLVLTGRVPPGGRAALEDFLAEATPFYESPGGIRVRLLWDRAEPERFAEVVEYADEATYSADQRRVDEDPAMAAHLTRWRTLLAGPPTVTTYDAAPRPATPPGSGTDRGAGDPDPFQDRTGAGVAGPAG